jgi:cytochrome c biogenesis protein
VPRGELFHIQNLAGFQNACYIPQRISYRINNFWITYTKESNTNQFYSDVSLFDKNGAEINRKIVFVNEPLMWNNLFLYQANWSLTGLKLDFEDNKNFQIPLKKIETGSTRFWFGSLVLDKNPVTIIVSDLSNKIFLYNSEGILVQNSLIGNSVSLSNGLNVKFLDIITNTGLQIKWDPSLSTIYFAFFLLLVSIYVSFFTYSQIWFLESLRRINIGGNSNRSVLLFQEYFRRLARSAAQ